MRWGLFAVVAVVLLAGVGLSEATEMRGAYAKQYTASGYLLVVVSVKSDDADFATVDVYVERAGGDVHLLNVTTGKYTAYNGWRLYTVGGVAELLSVGERIRIVFTDEAGEASLERTCSAALGGLRCS
jgi:hypothetical protein